MDNYENHLWPLIYDQYNHGRHEKELEFYYKEFKHRTGKILEVACGTGMIFLKLLSRGIDIYGLDISEQMLDILFKKADNMGLSKAKKRVTAQNMIDFKYDMKFDDIFIPARSFLHLSNQDEQIECLKNIYSHLNNGGRFLINFFNPNLRFLVENLVDSDEFKPLNTYDHPYKQGEKIELYYNQKNDIPEQIQNIVWKFSYSNKEYLTNMMIRWIYKEEFKLLLKLAGFTEPELYGDFDKSQYSYESQEMIWIVKK